MKKIILLVLIGVCSGFMLRVARKINNEERCVAKLSLLQKDSSVDLKKMSVTGDFDGDGKRDTLRQNTISPITHRQIDYFHEDQWDSIKSILTKLNLM